MLPHRLTAPVRSIPLKTRSFSKAVLAGQATACQQVNTSLKTSLSYIVITLQHGALWFWGNFQPTKVLFDYGVALSHCPGEHSSGGRLSHGGWGTPILEANSEALYFWLCLTQFWLKVKCGQERPDTWKQKKYISKGGGGDIMRRSPPTSSLR